MRRLVLLIITLFSVTCSAPPDDSLLVPGERAGAFILETSTRANILGDDTPANRKRFADQGIYFEFDRGRTLTAVTVTSSAFETREGLKVGSSPEAVQDVFGPPVRSRAEGDKIAFDILAYPGITFVPQEDRIMAIRIGPLEEISRPTPADRESN